MSTVGLRHDKVYELRCAECGRICWTTLLLGCKSCKSKSLEDFEPYDKVAIETGLGRGAVEQFSILFAQRAHSQKCRQLVGALRSYFDEAVNPITRAHSDVLAHELEKIVLDLSSGHSTGLEALRKIALAWNCASEKVKEEKEVVGLAAFQLAASLSRPPDMSRANEQHSYEVEQTFFDTPQAARFADVIASCVFDLIPVADQEGVRTYLFGPRVSQPPSNRSTDVHYDALFAHLRTSGKKTFHVSVSAATWEFLANLGRLVPVAYALLTQHLPSAVEIAAAAATVQTILKSVTKLRATEAEQCVFNGIINAKESVGHDPTASDILVELHKKACLGKPCKFAGHAYECSVTIEDVDAILKFLAEKKIVTKSSATAWAVV